MFSSFEFSTYHLGIPKTRVCGSGGRVTSYIWHSMDVRAEWPLFQAPFISKKYDWPHFSGFVYERLHFSDVSVYMHLFFVQRFFEATCFLDIQ